MKSSPKVRHAVKIASYIMTALLVAVGGGVAYLWFGALKPYSEGLEKPRVPLLKKIANAQNSFRSRDLDKDGVKDYGTLKELFAAKLLTEQEVYKAGFVFVEPATNDPENQWWAVAQPLHPYQGRSFFINQTDGIYYSSEEPWSFESRVNRKTADAPSGAQLLIEP